MPISIILVEDSITTLTLEKRILESGGYEVVTAVNGADALGKLSMRDFNAVVSDIMMPEMDGLQLARANFEGRFLPFVACTAVSDAATALDFLKYGVQDYVLKPAPAQTLLPTVRNAIARRQLPRVYAHDELPLPGNLGRIIIPARLSEIDRAQAWVGLKVAEVMGGAQRRKFLAFVLEFLMNAYEHGSLNITEEEKGHLLNKGGYEAELESRAQQCKAMIEVSVSVVGSQVAVNIIDDGYGFEYERYLAMKEEEMVDRLAKPNGRGIQMALHYFNKIRFGKGGSSVTLVKKTEGDG